MIINCPACQKKFQIDDNLIPVNGRLLQCGSCNNSWFFKPQITSKKDKDEKEIINKFDPKKVDITKKNKKKTQKKKIESIKIPKNYELTKYKKQSNFTFGKFLSYIIVLIITFVAFLIVIDTFKTPLYSSFPNLENIIFNLFETLTDIKLFIKDLL